MNWLKRLFHTHQFKHVETVLSNSKGEIWIVECECGERDKVTFDANGKCIHIEELKSAPTATMKVTYRKK
jgi:hypothetical protein